MGLVIWLPLINDLKNRGVSSLNTASVQSGVSSVAGGKLGNCYKNAGTNANVATAVSFSSDTFTLMAWVRVDTRRNNWCRSVGLAGSGTYIGLGCEHSNGTSIGFHYYKTIDGTNTSVFDNYPFTSDNGTWVHYAIAYDGIKYYIYKNGTLTTSATASKANIRAEMTTLYLFGGTSGNYSQHSLNDVRLYDNVVSAKEIKEISKGLVCHYPLNSQYEIGKLNKFSGDVSAGLVGPGSFTRTKLADERGYNYKLTRTGTGSSSWPSLGTAAYSFTAGKRYYYSVKVRCHKWSVGALRLRASRSSNDWVTNSVAVCSPSLADNKWHEYYTSQVVNATYDRSGTTVTCNPVLEFYADDQKTEGTVYDMDYDLKDVQVIEADAYQPFIENAFAGNTVIDTSGYGNNGTSTNTNITTEATKYDGSTKFNGSNAFIACGRGGMVTDAITISLWCYLSSWSSFSNPISCTEGGGWNFEKSGTKIQFPVGTGTSSNTYKTVQSTMDYSTLSAGWHMLTGTYDGLALKLYIDGVLNNTTTAYTTKTPIFYNSANGIFIGAEAGGNQTTPAGTYFNGNISDVRIYATALSADDIKELYNTPASISNTGAILCSDFTETLS